MHLARAFTQTATYWAPAVPNGYGGSSYGSPVEMLVRWENRKEQFQMPAGEIELSKAVVYAPEALEEGGYLYLGSSAAADPTTEHEAFEIRRVSMVPDLRNIMQEIRVYL